jgi:hypothetical protein
MKLTIEQVIEKYRKFAKEMFGWEMTLPVFEWNLKSRWGSFHYTYYKKAKKLVPKHFKISSTFIAGEYAEEHIDHNIKHELVHWYTDVTEGKPCKHNKKWKENCRKFGISDSRLNDYPKIGETPKGDIHIQPRKRDKAVTLANGQYHEATCILCNRIVVKSKNYAKLKAYIFGTNPTCVCGGHHLVFGNHKESCSWIPKKSNNVIWLSDSTKQKHIKKYGVIITDGTEFKKDKKAV